MAARAALRAWGLGVPMLGGCVPRRALGAGPLTPLDSSPPSLPLSCCSLPWLHGNPRIYSLVLYLFALKGRPGCEAPWGLRKEEAI